MNDTNDHKALSFVEHRIGGPNLFANEKEKHVVELHHSAGRKTYYGFDTDESRLQTWLYNDLNRAPWYLDDDCMVKGNRILSSHAFLEGQAKDHQLLGEIHELITKKEAKTYTKALFKLLEEGKFFELQGLIIFRINNQQARAWEFTTKGGILVTELNLVTKVIAWNRDN